MEREQLKGKQTPGVVIATGQDAFLEGRTFTSVDSRTEADADRLLCMVLGDHFDEQGKANAALYAEAHNVANDTGMWPLDMLNRIKELEAELEEIRQQGLDQPI